VLRAAREAAAKVAQQFDPSFTVAPLVAALVGDDGAPSERRPAVPPLSLNAWLRWDLVAPVIESVPVGRVLEIGPGRGAVAVRLAELGHEYVGVEMADDTRALTSELLAARGLHGRLCASFDELGPDERFDLVCSFEVIEHIDDDDAALKVWVDRLAPGGMFVLSTPADPARYGPWDELAGHFRRYADDDVADMVRRAGLIDVHVRRYGGIGGDVLEFARNLIARVSARGRSTPSDGDDMRTRTERSSSLLQPGSRLGACTRLLSAPARIVQRRTPRRGPGIVLTARSRPDVG
ncbi:MAG: class I SAM-dependent methyltransferase, partial [Actinomycetes bacterium]